MTGEIITAAQLNTHLRDNLLATAAGVVTAAGDLVYATAANALARRAIGSSGQVLTVSGGVPVWASPFGLTSSTGTLGADAALTVGVYTDLVSLSLAAGTWLLLGTLTADAAGSAGGAQQYGARLRNDTAGTVLKEANNHTNGTTNTYSSATVVHVVALGSTSTIKLQGASSSSSCTARANAANITGTPPGVPGTQLVAVRIA